MNPEEDLMKRLILYFLLLLVVTGVQLFYLIQKQPVLEKPDLEIPSPALGQAIATTIHQAVTDPYFAPLEQLARFLSERPGTKEIAVDMLTKWAPDNEFPTCFVYDVETQSWQVDHPVSPWVLEKVLEFMSAGITSKGQKGRTSVTEFKAENETWWLGYLRIPRDSYQPDQICGVFFSIDRYLELDVPRLIEHVVARSRFPIVPFQQTPPVDLNRLDGAISFRILTADGEVYLQRGSNFELDQMIYSENQWYSDPIVCMQRGWDLQVFSTQANPAQPGPKSKQVGILILVGSLIIVSIVYWIAVSVARTAKN